MDANTIQEILHDLKQVRRNWPNGTRDRASQELLDTLVDRLERAVKEENTSEISSGGVLQALSKILASGGKFADLIRTILERL